MTIEKRKLELINGAVKIEKSSSLEKLDDLFVQAEMQPVRGQLWIQNN